MSNGQVIEWIIANPQWWCCAPVLLILVVGYIRRKTKREPTGSELEEMERRYDEIEKQSPNYPERSAWDDLQKKD